MHNMRNFSIMLYEFIKAQLAQPLYYVICGDGTTMPLVSSTPPPPPLTA
jgi:hypothetical protein